MPTDRPSQCTRDHPIQGSLAEIASYLTMLGHWARGDVTLEIRDTADGGMINGSNK